MSVIRFCDAWPTSSSSGIVYAQGTPVAYWAANHASEIVVLLPHFIIFCGKMLTMGSKGFTIDDCPLPPGSRVAGYFRDSGGDEQERSVDQQRCVAGEYREQHHMVLVRIFADEARPGGTIVGRDRFDDLIHYRRQYAPSGDRLRGGTLHPGSQA